MIQFETKDRTAAKHPLRTIATACLVGCVFVASGCEFLGLDGGAGDATQQPKPPQLQQANTPPPAEPPKPKPAADLEEYERPEYPEMARRNPFQPDPEIVKPANLPTDGEERTLEPLERFAIGELALVAIISEVAVPKAMFIDPDGFGHVLREGDRIGQNSGTISDIRDNEVEITETTGEDQNKTRLRNVKLRDVELRVGDGSGLTDEEREALEKLLETEEGREALERQYRDMALGASAVDGQQRSNTGQQPPRQQGGDRRFPGFARRQEISD